MHKVWLIAAREYITRVRKKTFIIATLLTPIGFGLLMILGGFLAAKGGESTKKIVVKDESGYLAKSDLSDKSLTYKLSQESLPNLKETYQSQGYDVLVYVPTPKDSSAASLQVSYYTDEKLSINTINDIERAIAKGFRDYKIEHSEISMDVYNSFKTDITLENGEIVEQIQRGEEPKASGKLAVVIGTALGGLMGFLMYMVIFIYGGMVMRSVMEEKINRVVEIMISSVKPVQLMLGKILGVGAVGLTQLAIWLVLIPLIIYVSSQFFGVSPSDTTGLQEAAQAARVDDNTIQKVIQELGQMNWWLIIPVFVLFFFCGYFIYASLFAAIGSAIGDDMGEGQQLMIPIVIPVALAFVMLQGVLANPNGSMAVFGSLFPLTSPILMPARLAFDPPIIQVLLSIVILIASCIGVAWVAGRIYRIGILLYGKKVSFKEIGKWLFYKG
jgi:ABC-2 type transport system permease protein